MGSGGMDPLIINFDTSEGEYLVWGNGRFIFGERASGGPQSGFGRFGADKNVLTLFYECKLYKYKHMWL